MYLCQHENMHHLVGTTSNTTCLHISLLNGTYALAVLTH